MYITPMAEKGHRKQQDYSNVLRIATEENKADKKWFSDMNFKMQ